MGLLRGRALCCGVPRACLRASAVGTLLTAACERIVVCVLHKYMVTYLALFCLVLGISLGSPACILASDLFFLLMCIGQYLFKVNGHVACAVEEQVLLLLRERERERVARPTSISMCVAPVSQRGLLLRFCPW